MSKKKTPPPEETTPGLAINAELAYIGCLLLNPSVRDRTQLTGAHFADSGLGALCDAIGILADAGKPVTDVAWLFAELKHMDVPGDARSLRMLRAASDAAVNWAHAVSHADQITEAYKRRQSDKAGEDFLADVRDASVPLDQAIGNFERRLTGLAGCDRLRSRNIGEVAAELLAGLERPPEVSGPKVFSGFQAFDERNGPWPRGSQIVVGGRTSSGKSAFMANISENNALKGRRVLYVSLEMECTEIVMRVLCGRAGVDSRKVLASSVTREEKSRLADEAIEVGRIPFEIIDKPNLSVRQIRAAARHQKATAGLDLLAVDYLQLIEPENFRDQRHLQLGKITGALKQLAKELRIVVLVGAQLNRKGDENPDEEPRLIHLRESGSIEQDADQVLLIHHARGSAESDAYSRGVRILIAKNRNGPTGVVNLLWREKVTKFVSPEVF